MKLLLTGGNERLGTELKTLPPGQDYVDVIAPQIVVAIRHAEEIGEEVLHIATERKSVYELARRRKADVREGSRASASVRLPGDVSLDSRHWAALRAGWQSGG